tara:strand:- start:205 stop:876 length:672 start_codon:yes stop_codon:yes gene_type:complete
MIYLFYILLLFIPLNNTFSISRRSLFLTTTSTSMSVNNFKNNSNINYYNVDDDNDSILHIMKNNLFFSGSITSQSIFAITTNLFALQHSEYPEINLHIQSPGGSLLPTLGVIDLIKTSDIPINTYVDGYVASAATLITVVGANKLMGKYSTMLIHQLKMGTQSGKYDEIKDSTTNADTLMRIIKDIYLSNSNIDKDTLDFLLNHDLLLNSSQCKKYGFVNYII